MRLYGDKFEKLYKQELGILGRLGWFEMHSGSWELFATRRAEQVCYLYASFRKRDKHRDLLPPVVPS